MSNNLPMRASLDASIARAEALAQNGNGNCGFPANYMASQMMGGLAGTPNFMKWSPSLGDCPTDLSRLLCWQFKGYCSFNRFGKIGTSRLVTNTITLPDPIGGFNIGPEGQAVSMGVFFPRDWVGEACMKGMYRFKVSFQATVQETVSGLTTSSIEHAAYEVLDLRVLQVGTLNNSFVVISIGDAQEAQASNQIPSQGGFWLGCGNEFIPFCVAPEIQAYDTRGLMPGVNGDVYTLTANITTYWKPVC